MNPTTNLYRPLKIIITSIVIIAVTGCGLITTPYARYVKKPAPGHDILPLNQEEHSLRLAGDFGAMALFAHVVYRRDLKQQELSSACDFANGQTSLADDYGMPRNGTSGWKRLTKNKAGGEKTCVIESGLFFETYVHETEKGKPDLYVIAFRGTENSPNQFLNDWSANLSAAFGRTPKQYALAEKYLSDLLQAIPSDIPIFAVGHSLGGGLAQQSGYRFRRISKVFAFNSTPVTNWTWLRVKGKIEQDHPVIYRFTHGGEVLEPIRFVTTLLSTTRYRRYDIGVQYHGRNLFSGHSIEVLACTLSALIAGQTERTPEPEYYLYRSYAKDQLFDSGVCQPKYKDSIKLNNIKDLDKLFKEKNKGDI